VHEEERIGDESYHQRANGNQTVSILKDKLPVSVLDKAHIVVELSNKSKLFRIEED
jgi:hypothetical protein